MSKYLSNKLLRYTPDIYTRYYLGINIIKSAIGDKKIKILDIGGRGGILGDFIKLYKLPYTLHVIDIRKDLKSNPTICDKYIVGEFPTKKLKTRYDFTTSFDVFEHIDDKVRFINGLLEHSELSILTAPFHSPSVNKCENLVNNYFKKYTGKAHPWLKEHIETRLPKSKWFESFLDSKNIKYLKIDSNYLINWINFLLPNLIPAYLPIDKKSINRINLFYNKNFLKLGDCKTPSYRSIYTIINKKISEKKILSFIKSLKIDGALNLKLEFEKLVIDSITEIAINEHRNLKKQAETFHKILLQKDDNIRSKDHLIYEQSRVLSELQSECNTFRAFKEGYIWRSLEKYRKIKKLLKPTVKINQNNKNIKDKRDLEKTYFSKLNKEMGKWLNSRDSSTLSLKMINQILSSIKYKPKISIILPIYNTEKKWLLRCLKSVTNQIYTNWELCIADDASTVKYIKPLLKRFSKGDNRVKVTFRKANGHICRASNSALKLATGEYIALLDHDDELSYEALLKIVEALNQNQNLDYIYSDEDKVDLNNIKVEPYIKPSWSQDRLYSYMYTGHLSVYKKTIIDKVKGFRTGTHGAQDYDLLLRSLKYIKKIHHIEEILYHWRKVKESTALSLKAKPYAMKAGKKVLSSHLKEQTKSEFHIHYSNRGFYKIRIPLNRIKVDFLVKDTRNTNIYKQVKTQLGTNISKSHTYKNTTELYKILASSKSDISLICNDPHIQIYNPENLEYFLGYMQLPKVAIIGPKILDSDNKVFSNGLILTSNGIYTPYREKKDFCGYSNILETPCNYSSISSIFFAINNKLFREEYTNLCKNYEVMFPLDISLHMWNKNLRTVALPHLKIIFNGDKKYYRTTELKEYSKIKKDKISQNYIHDIFFPKNLLNKILI